MVRAKPRTLRPRPQKDQETARSGTRPVAKKARKSERPTRESQRPTMRVPASESLASYVHAPPRIQDNIATVPAMRVIPRAPAVTDFGAGTLDVFAPVDDVPFLACSSDTLLVAKLDHREGFVLSLVDGQSNVESLIDTCPMPAEETRRILLELHARGLVGLRKPRRRPT